MIKKYCNKCKKEVKDFVRNLDDDNLIYIENKPIRVEICIKCYQPFKDREKVIIEEYEIKIEELRKEVKQFAK